MLFKGMKGWGEEGALACMGERTSVVEMPTSAQATEARWSEHQNTQSNQSSFCAAFQNSTRSCTRMLYYLICTSLRHVPI